MAVLDLLEKRGHGKSICPSEAARKVAGDDSEIWRALMPRVRETAARLADEGALIVTQKGKPVDPLAARGPIRLFRPIP